MIKKIDTKECLNWNMEMDESVIYVERLSAMFSSRTNEELGRRMSAYMKNNFPFLGIQSPLRKQLTKAFTHEHGYPSSDQLDFVVMECWEQPWRELHYAAMEIASRKVYMSSKKRIDLIKKMIITNSWWDTVDFIAGNMAGPWFQQHPERTKAVTGAWMNSGNIWLQRSALLFQLKYRKNTDEELLYEYIRRLRGEPDFFIRKAIGWALREYAKTNPFSVKSFVVSEDLSALSRKEALKHF